MAAILGMTVAHERPSRVQLVGIAATLVAVTLLAASGSG
jgi:drug/metabolite transporter (DMT)-like permease